MAKLELRGRKVKILATIGPASRDPAMLRKLLLAGVDAFRVNMSHGEHDIHAETIAAIRALEKEFHRPITVLCDLQGPKLRVGTFAGGQAVLRHGSHFTLDRNPEPGDETRVCLPHPELFGLLHKGQRLLINDGKIRLRVIRADEDAILCSAEVGGVISDRKGVNVPDAEVPIPALTEKDRRDLAFAVKHGADWIALSFVQRAEDLAEARRLMGGHGALCAKIEKPQAVQRLGEILELADGVMVARGDLGVELHPEEVPPLQKRIVNAARTLGKPVIVATQMLESMITSPTPTRAEASDVANAVYEGADAVMLSAETAAGQYPVEAVTMMEKVILRTEQDPAYGAMLHAQRLIDEVNDGTAVAVAARDMAQTLGARAIVTLTRSGDTTGRVSRERPNASILALSDDEVVARNLQLYWGVHAVVVEELDSFAKMNELAETVVTREHLAEAGDTVVVVGGFPIGASVNTVRIGKAR